MYTGTQFIDNKIVWIVAAGLTAILSIWLMAAAIRSGTLCEHACLLSKSFPMGRKEVRLGHQHHLVLSVVAGLAVWLVAAAASAGSGILILYSGTSDKGPSEKGTTSLQRTHLSTIAPIHF